MQFIFERCTFNADWMTLARTNGTQSWMSSNNSSSDLYWLRIHVCRIIRLSISQLRTHDHMFAVFESRADIEHFFERFFGQCLSFQERESLFMNSTYSESIDVFKGNYCPIDWKWQHDYWIFKVRTRGNAIISLTWRKFTFVFIPFMKIFYEPSKFIFIHLH